MANDVFGGYAESDLTFAFNYKAQEKFDQLDIGAYYTRQPMVLGLWYRGLPVFKAYEPGSSNDDAIAFLVGIKKGSCALHAKKYGALS